MLLMVMAAVVQGVAAVRRLAEHGVCACVAGVAAVLTLSLRPFSVDCCFSQCSVCCQA